MQENTFFRGHGSNFEREGDRHGEVQAVKGSSHIKKTVKKKGGH